jgi:hypothetical protein
MPKNAIFDVSMNPTAADLKKYQVTKNPNADEDKIDMLKHFAAYKWEMFYSPSVVKFVDIEQDSLQ